MKQSFAKKIIGLILLSFLASTISIPLTIQRPRCMLSEISHPDQILNINVYFPTLPEQTPNQQYEIVIKNNFTGELVIDSLANGEYKKQLRINSMDIDNSIYQICFSLKSARNLDPVLISYRSEFVDPTGTSSLSQYPESLLKDSQLEETEKIVAQIQEAIRSLRKKEVFRAKRNHESEEEYLNKTDKLVFVTVLEIAAIILVGIYQFFQIKKIIDKNY